MTTSNLHIISSPADYSEKEKLYLEVRKKEQRIVSDNELPGLPFPSVKNPHSGEWKIRASSFTVFSAYLSRKKIPLKILDLGCGNGWLAHRFSLLPEATVDAVDLNLHELEQAARIFRRENLYFYYLDILKEQHVLSGYDIIVLAASVQYFPSLSELLNQLLPLLKKNGEIHIIDSHFYSKSEAKKASLRSWKYYESLGYSAMAEHYFHHQEQELKAFRYSLMNRFTGYRLVLLFRAKSYLYFPWIKVTR